MAAASEESLVKEEEHIFLTPGPTKVIENQDECEDGNEEPKFLLLHTTPAKMHPSDSVKDDESPEKAMEDMMMFDEPIIVETVDQSMEDSELIEILEGDGSEDRLEENVDLVEIDENGATTNYEIKIVANEVLTLADGKIDDPDVAKEIAMRQMMSLPVKKRGRKKKETNQNSTNNNEAAEVDNNKLSTSEDKANGNNLLVISQVRKKKIFWDPDSVERQPTMIIEETQNVCKKASTTPPQAKKKRSEIDRLLGDEGAINMLYSIEKSVDTGGETEDMAAKVELIKQASSSVTTTPRNRVKRENLISPPDKVPAKKKPKPKRKLPTATTPEEHWDGDLMMKQKCDDSMIVRRRSNSTDYSADLSPRRLSLDVERRISVDHLANQQVGGQLDRAKVLKMKDKLNQMMTIKKHKAKPAQDDESGVISKGDLGNISILKYKNYVQIQLFSATDNSCLLTIEKLQELRNTLQLLQLDNACHLVLISSAALSFCDGLAVKEMALNKTSMTEHKKAAQQLASEIRKFLCSLAGFKKPIVAAINGQISGFGVMILPLFDVIFCEEESVFSTSYSTIGQIPEGNAILDFTNKLNGNLVSRLLYLEDHILARDAEVGGLVTKVLSSEHFYKKVKEMCQNLSETAFSTISARKSLWMDENLQKLSAQLQKEEQLLVKQWTSKNCLDNIKMLKGS